MDMQFSVPDTFEQLLFKYKDGIWNKSNQCSCNGTPVCGNLFAVRSICFNEKIHLWP